MRAAVCAAALAVLSLGLAAGAAAEIPTMRINTPEELVSALNEAAVQSRSAVLELQRSVSLTQSAVAGYALPFQLGKNLTLELRGGNGQAPTLDLGRVHELLYFQSGTTLVVTNLTISGTADPLAQYDMPTSIPSLNLWPTIGGEPGFMVLTRGTTMLMYPSELCTPDEVAKGVAYFQSLAGVGNEGVRAEGLSGLFVNFTVSVPVVNASSESLAGQMSFTAQDTVITCTQPNKGGGSSSGTPAWVWAVVGVGAALAVAVVAGTVLWRRWRSRAHARSLLHLQTLQGVVVSPGEDKTASGVSSAVGSKDGSDTAGLPPRSDSGPAGSAAAPASQPSGSREMEVWKSRVGFIEGLEIGGLLGGGGYGRVYKGRWKGTHVAVKVVETQVQAGQTVDLCREPLLSMHLSHPNVLQSFQMCVVRVLPADKHDIGGDGGGGSGSWALGAATESAASAASGSGGGAGRVVPSLTDRNSLVQVMPPDAVLEEGMYETWLVFELADRGSLADAINAKWFAAAGPQRRDMLAILMCLLDIARGLEYLHSQAILHGDLKGQNVLLKASRTDRRGYVCKLCDFGLSRMLAQHQTHIQTGNYGTATHAAPELLREGRLTKAADIYAFGIVMWEVLSGGQAFHDVPALTVICLVAHSGYRPPLPPDCPEPLADLMQRCWKEAPQARPQASAVVQELMALVAEAKT